MIVCFHITHLAKKTVDLLLDLELKKLQQYGYDLKTYYASLEKYKDNE
jgi:hypothetical protein